MVNIIDTYSFIEHEAQIAYLKIFVILFIGIIPPNYKISTKFKNKHTKIFGVRETPQSKMKRICCHAMIILLKGLQWIANIVMKN